MSKSDEAEREKELGNRTFLNGNYARAIDHYSAAIELNSEVATYYSNRSACYSKMKAYDKAMEDAAKCIEIDPSFLKGYYRLAIAHEGRNHLKLAIETLQTTSTFQLHSKNLEILSKLQDLQKKLAHQKRVIGKEVLRLCRLSRWESLPVLFTRTTRIRIHDQDLDDDDEYSESVAHWYSTAYPGEADLEIRCSGSQMTPLLFAVSSGAVSTINLLLQHGACADLAMPVAIAYLQPNSIRELLRHGYGIDRDAFSYLVAPNPYNTWFTSSSQDFDILLNMESMSEVAKTTNSLGVKVYIPQLDELLDRQSLDEIIDALQLLISNGADVNQEFLEGYENGVPKMAAILRPIWYSLFISNSGTGNPDMYPIALFLVQSGAEIGNYRFHRNDFVNDDDDDFVDHHPHLRVQLVHESNWYRRRALMMVVVGMTTSNGSQSPFSKIVYLKELIELIMSYV